MFDDDKYSLFQFLTKGTLVFLIGSVIVLTVVCGVYALYKFTS